MILPSNEVKKIGVFRALQLGDMLNVMPAIRALRYAYPSAKITLLGMPWAKSFVARFSNYFDRFIHFPGYSGLPEQPFDETVYKGFLEAIYAEQFDLLLQMQGNGTVVNGMMEEWQAKHLAGYCNDESYVASPLFMKYPNEGSEIHRHLKLMEHLGIPSQGDDLQFPILEKDVAEWEALRFPFLPKTYVCVHPGSRGAWRQWPPADFAKLADVCAAHGLQPIITGTEDEKKITAAVIDAMKHEAIDMTGKTSLGSIALLIKNAFCLISNCTGVAHIASATKTPSIIISMDGEPERWAPLDKKIHFVTDWTKLPEFSIPLQHLEKLLAKKEAFGG